MKSLYKDLIEAELLAIRNSDRADNNNIDKLIAFLNDNGYYKCSCSTHNKWSGGTAEHVWAVFQIALHTCDEKKKTDPAYIKYGTREKLAIVCLLHDMCDIKGIQVLGKGYRNGRREDVSWHHGKKSYWLMRNLGVGTVAEQEAVQNHMYRSNDRTRLTGAEKVEYDVLHTLVSSADHDACGSAWNSDFFIKKLTQGGTSNSSDSYRHRVAMDRTRQVLDCKVFLDEDGCLWSFMNYRGSNIKWDCSQQTRIRITDPSINSIDFLDEDYITAAHVSFLNTGNKACIIIGCDSSIPDDGVRNLRQNNRNERQLLICSNILLSAYQAKDRCGLKHKDGSPKKEYKYLYTMRDQVKKEFSKVVESNGSIYMPDVTFFREGSSKGFAFVAPWKADVILIPGCDGLAKVIV